MVAKVDKAVKSDGVKFYRIKGKKKELVSVKPRKLIAKRWGGKKFACKKKFTVKRKVRKSIEVGKVAIILAGKHIGKRCIITNILDSGLVVVTNPLDEAKIPLRRVDPTFLIVTSTNIFNFEKLKKTESALKKAVESITDNSFLTKKEIKKKVRKLLKSVGEQPQLFMNDFEDKYKTIKDQHPKREALSKIQAEVDNLIKSEIEKDAVFCAYLKTKFTMRTEMSLHKMKF